ncbi:hypothetical protein DFH06DRAFT_537775 [Mycena polygramma]|nr:hypothetical protein DFH06DRAFT_537775 [Mycena polygramma]
MPMRQQNTTLRGDHHVQRESYGYTTETATRRLTPPTSEASHSASAHSWEARRSGRPYAAPNVSSPASISVLAHALGFNRVAPRAFGCFFATPRKSPCNYFFFRAEARPCHYACVQIRKVVQIPRRLNSTFLDETGGFTGTMQYVVQNTSVSRFDHCSGAAGQNRLKCHLTQLQLFPQHVRIWTSIPASPELRSCTAVPLAY